MEILFYDVLLVVGVSTILLLLFPLLLLSVWENLYFYFYFTEYILGLVSKLVIFVLVVLLAFL